MRRVGLAKRFTVEEPRMTVRIKLQLVVIADDEEVCVDDVVVLDKQHERLELWDGKTSRACSSAMLTPCLMFSASCSRPCKPRRANARIWSSRTCSCAINSPCSPGRLDADRQLGFTSGTSCCGSWLADSASAGASTCRSSHPRRSFAGIGRAVAR